MTPDLPDTVAAAKDAGHEKAREWRRTPDVTAWETVREYIAHNATSKETPRAEALAALASLQAAYEAMERELSELGLRNAELRRRLRDAERERDALQHIIDCADTPLMRDVLREREELEAALREIEIQSRYAFPGYEDTPYAKINAIARAALASGKDKP